MHRKLFLQFWWRLERQCTGNPAFENPVPLPATLYLWLMLLLTRTRLMGCLSAPRAGGRWLMFSKPAAATAAATRGLRPHRCLPADNSSCCAHCSIATTHTIAYADPPLRRVVKAGLLGGVASSLHSVFRQQQLLQIVPVRSHPLKHCSNCATSLHDQKTLAFNQLTYLIIALDRSSCCALLHTSPAWLPACNHETPPLPLNNSCCSLITAAHRLPYYTLNTS